ncbi:MAG TPA: nitroreductase family protein, partial [Chitinophagales bacterium]|nr:nitroreductase family protein [Chitinophagales bacterium]
MQHNNSLNTIIRSRRSVKPEQYNTTPIAESIILEMLENARWAPTHARTEPWRFVVCTGDGLKRFAEYQAE